MLRFLLLSILPFCVLSHAPQLRGQDDDVTTGPGSSSSGKTSSRYLRGVAPEESAPALLRILGGHVTTAGISLQAIVLDSSGLEVSHLGLPGKWTLEWGCADRNRYEAMEPIVQGPLPPRSAVNHYQIMIDNSLTSQGLLTAIAPSVREVLSGYSESDSFSISTFSQTTTEVCGWELAVDASRSLAETKLSAPKGIPAVYTAMMSGLRVFDKKSTTNNILIFVTASDDLASLDVSVNDVVRYAKQRGVTMYVIKIGTSVRGYPYRYISEATGGRLYSIHSTSADGIDSVIKEILLSRNNHAEVFATKFHPSTGCPTLQVHLLYTHNNRVIADTFSIPVSTVPFRRYNGAIVAAFDDTTDSNIQEYYSGLTLLASNLMADTLRRIRIIGHVGSEITSNATRRGFERARHVADFLKALGVRDEQIEIQSRGSSKPMFLEQVDGTQKMLNNRVEALYITPADDPYSIVVDYVVSEQIAGTKVTDWEKRGYKAYFEAALNDGRPEYEIILWGYKTREAAQKAASELRSKYGVKEYLLR